MKLTTILIFVVLMTSLMILACRHDDVYLKFYHRTDLKPMKPISAVKLFSAFFRDHFAFTFFQAADYQEDEQNP